MREWLIPGRSARRGPTQVFVFDVLLLPSQKVMGVGGVGNPRSLRVFQATCGRVLCVHRRDTVHALFAMVTEEVVQPIEDSARCVSSHQGATPSSSCERVIRTFPAVRAIERRGRRWSAPR